MLRQSGKQIIDTETGNAVNLVGCFGVLKCLYYNDLIFQGEERLNEAKRLGMQILRIGINMGRYTTAPYTYDDGFFTQPGGLDSILDWCNRNNVKVCLNASFTINFGDYFNYAESHGFPAYMTPATDYTNDDAGMRKAWTDFWHGRTPQEDSRAQLIDAWLHVVNRYKDTPCIEAWDIPVNEPCSGYPTAGWEPEVLRPVYWAFVRSLIDAIRSIDPDRLLMVETLDICCYGLPSYADAIGRPNCAYDVHPYAAGGLSAVYDPTLPGIAQNGATGWNKAGVEAWLYDNVIDALMNRFNTPVIIGEIDHLINSQYGDWHQYYWDIYDLFFKNGLTVATAFRGGAGAEYGLYYPDGTVKPFVDVLTNYSQVAPPTPPIPTWLIPAGLIVAGLLYLGTRRRG